MLEALGLSQLAESVYLLLLRAPDQEAGALAAELGADRAAVSRALAELAELGLLERPEGVAGWSAVAPDLAVEPLLARREEELRRTRGRLGELMRGYHRGRAVAGPSELVEVVTGRAAITEAWLHMRDAAREQVLVFDRAPYVHSDAEDDDAEIEQLGRGVQWRGLYECGMFRDPEALGRVTALAAAGERAGMLPLLPFKLAIVDQRWALLPMYAGAELASALIVRPSSLLDALVATFEAHWRRGLPLPAPGQSVDDQFPARFDRELLTLLAAGLTDESIARQLGVSIRTVQRRVRALMDVVDARTRFQAGLQVAHAGWL